MYLKNSMCFEFVFQATKARRPKYYLFYQWNHR